ncbi:MAG: twin-arginine translocase TatA/TatE family subunit [bacterium]
MNAWLALIPTGSEWIWIVLIIVLLFGASKLPELMRSFGRGIGEFKKAKRDFEKELNEASKEEKPKKDGCSCSCSHDDKPQDSKPA